MSQKYENFIRLSEVIKRTGISRSSIYRLVNKNKFPAPVKISEKNVAFIESEINDWIEKLINSSRNKAA
ncbi:AlpA family transcriptional regulator [Pantoea sp. ACRSH]|uniref:helix-turn-helix transcriptional regulator n=1 Tax=Enterobacterales TaxID=91347 RepID=UPI001EF45BA3|nr:MULTISPECIES: AlpA family transcriptional regulator [unclassified Pantoea]MCG7367147.1 AlpA family transcriptional regulator [Pantoea sp. ACRSH]MCG7397894.1 AlpA family transcriptional regulator [Pantoea sp. ACRSC]